MEKARVHGAKGKQAGHAQPKHAARAAAKAAHKARKEHPKHAAHQYPAGHKHLAGHKPAEPKGAAPEASGKAGEKQAAKGPAVKFSEKQFEQTGALKVYEVLEYPLVSEKAVNMIGTENKLVFVVNGKATRQDVRKAVEAMYNVKVIKVNICRDMKARKKAFVRLDKAFKAEDLATKLGVL